jgi:hypothetical protein
MKKLMVFVLTTILLISGLPANAAVKAGAKCKVVGQIKVNKNKEFTCIKKGSKLVWKKGKIVITAKKANKESIPTVSSTPASSGTAITYKFSKVTFDAATLKFGGNLSLKFNLVTNDPEPKAPYCILDMVINPFEATLSDGTMSDGNWSCSAPIPDKPLETNPSGNYTVQLLAVSRSSDQIIEERKDVAVLKSVSSSPTKQVSDKPVSAGAFCKPAGATGKSAKGVDYTCKTSDTDSRNRWRQ